jgi:hypothetical protein
LATSLTGLSQQFATVLVAAVKNIKDGLWRRQDRLQDASSTSIAARADPECLPIREFHPLWLLLFRDLPRIGRALLAPALLAAIVARYQ